MELKIADDTFVYSLNEDGANRVWFNVSGGWVDRHTRTSHEECARTAALLAAAPGMAEALRNAIPDMEAAYDALEKGWTNEPLLCLGHHLAKFRAALAKAGL